MKSNTRRRLSAAPAKDQTCLKIERMEAERLERRKNMQQRKKERAAEEQRNLAQGNPGDVDFIGMVRRWRQHHKSDTQPHAVSNQKICICVRKRPISEKEREKNDHDSVTVYNPTVWIHSAKFRVDGITKYLDHQSFVFDHAFSETVSNDVVYKHTTMPLLDYVVAGMGGRATVFAFGQTGSGKTHTMQGIQMLLAEDLFMLLQVQDYDYTVSVSFFEMYSNSIQDLLNERNRLKVLEDAKGEINVTGLTEQIVHTPQQLLDVLELGNQERTTHTTQANDTSSRSHAICQIALRNRTNKKLAGKMSLVDLAGSERGSDTKTHNAQRRGESAEINTSLLALKECIRAGNGHVPYRSSKLTLILKDCFVSDKSMCCMIATVSPGASAADHSLNTLRYADRTKDKSSKKKVTPVRKRPTTVPSKVASSKPVASSSSTTTTTNSSSKPAPAKAPLQIASNPCASRQPAALRENDSQQQPSQPLAKLSTTQLEEAILNTHMRNIQENAELLTQEGTILADIQRGSGMEQYAGRLEEILHKKETMILELRKQMAEYKKAAS